MGQSKPNLVSSYGDPSVLFRGIGLDPSLTSVDVDGEESPGIETKWRLTGFQGGIEEVEFSCDEAIEGYEWTMSVACSGPYSGGPPGSVHSKRTHSLRRLLRSSVEWSTDSEMYLMPDKGLLPRLKSKLESDHQVRSRMLKSGYDVQVVWTGIGWIVAPEKNIALVEPNKPTTPIITANLERLKVLVSSREQWEIFEAIATVIAALDEE